jgi:hypothetical protein
MTIQRKTLHRSRWNWPSIVLAFVGMGFMGTPFFAQNVAAGSAQSDVETHIAYLHPGKFRYGDDQVREREGR